MELVSAAELVGTLVRLRRQRGISRTRIADAAGYTRETIKTWEEGHYPSALDLAATWAHVVGHELVIAPRLAPGAPPELAQLVAALAALHTTPPDAGGAEPIEG